MCFTAFHLKRHVLAGALTGTLPPLLPLTVIHWPPVRLACPVCMRPVLGGVGSRPQKGAGSRGRDRCSC